MKRWQFDRAHRWLFNFTAAMSLLLCIAALVLWVRSYTGSDLFGWTHLSGIRGQSTELFTSRGSIAIVFIPFNGRPNYIGDADRFRDGYNFYAQRRPGPPYFTAGPATRGGYGFRFFDGTDMPPLGFQDNIQFVDVPLWSVVMITLILPSIWFVRRLGHPVRPGLCLACGYDLRATPERCPECGKMPAPEGGAT